MASRIDACSSRIEGAVRMNQVTDSMKGVVRAMDKGINAMDIDQISKLMDKFEQQFEDLDVKTQYSTFLFFYVFYGSFFVAVIFCQCVCFCIDSLCVCMHVCMYVSFQIVLFDYVGLNLCHPIAPHSIYLFRSGRHNECYDGFDDTGGTSW